MPDREPPQGCSFLGTITGKREDEDCYHGKFAQHRLEGEWFDGKIIEEVLGIISAHKQSRLIIRRKIVPEQTTEPQTNGAHLPPEPEGEPVPSNGALDKDAGIEGISRIPGLKLKKLSVKLAEDAPNRQQDPSVFICRAEVVYVLEFDADMTDEAALNELRKELGNVSPQTPGKRLTHAFHDEDNAMIPFSPNYGEHHIVSGRDAITGFAGDGIRIVVGWY